MSNSNGKRPYTRRTLAEQAAALEAKLQRLREAEARGVSGAVNLDDPATVALRALATACARAQRYGTALGGTVGNDIAATGRMAFEHVKATAELHGIGLPDPETKRGRPVAFFKAQG